MITAIDVAIDLADCVFQSGTGLRDTATAAAPLAAVLRAGVMRVALLLAQAQLFAQVEAKAKEEHHNGGPVTAAGEIDTCHHLVV